MPCKKSASPKPRLSKSRRLLRRGDHIYRPIRYTPYQHHGIYVGNDQVIHYAAPAEKSFIDLLLNRGPVGEIRQTSLAEFMAGFPIDQVKRVDYGRYAVATPATIVRRAKRRLGESLYDARTRNCEHFAYWCVTGKERCAQLAETGRVVRDLAGHAVAAAAGLPPTITPLPLKPPPKRR
jgi:hypothetical protein